MVTTAVAAAAGAPHIGRALPIIVTKAALPAQHRNVEHITPLMTAVAGFASQPRLGQLPPLPMRTVANTARPRFRPMAADGDSITINAFYGCGANQGQIYATGCLILWRFNAAVSSGADQLEDCYASSEQPNTVADCSSAHTGNPWESTTLSTAGTWVLGTLDVTTGKWLAVVYLPVTSPTVYLDTFSDQFYKNEGGQFTAASGKTVYIQATGLTGGSEKYEVYVEYTSVSPYCVYTAPAESPAAGADALCNPANDSGDLTTSNGTLQVAWPLSTSYPSGTYSIVLWDVTAGQRLAEREVSIAASSSGSLTITPAGGNASPNPKPAGTPGAIFAYDSQNEDSDSALTFAATGLGFTGQIKLAISDPTGQVQQTYTGNSTGGTYGGQSWNIQTLMTPSNYPFDAWTATITSATSGAVLASKAFRMVGYSLQTEFTDPLSTALTMSTTQQTTTLQFTNTGASVYGAGNGDPISAIAFDDGTKGIVLTLGDGTASTTGVCAGAASCQTETAVDSSGVSWSVYNYCAGNGNNESCTIYASPMTAGNALATGASLTILDLEYQKNSNGANCTTGCAATTTILPKDGLTWSSSTQTVATNPVYFTKGTGGKTYAATGHIYLYGYRTGANRLHAGEEVHGYTVRAATAGETSVTYTATSPSSSGTASLVYAVTITNNSSGGTTGISKFEVQLPSAFSGGIAGAKLDAASPTAWLIVNCPGGTPSNTVCFQRGGGNNNGIVAGTSQTLYFDIAPPASSFAYTDAAIQVSDPAAFGVTADARWTEFAGPTPGPATVDSTALVGYSLNSTYMSVVTSPQSIGQNVTKNITFAVTNTNLGSDANPDYLDAVVIAVPTANAFNTFSVTNTGWSELGSYVVGANTYYFFGLCSTQASAIYEPPNNGMPSCGQAIEQADAIGPGGSLTFTANLTSGTGNVAMEMYAHGANGNGWSAAKNFSETVTTTSLDAGFSAVGAAPPPAVANGSIPSVGADSSSTLGNYYVYTLQNTSSGGGSNNVSSVTITVPGRDTSGENGTDGSGKSWTITSAPTLSGTGFSGCSVTAYSSASTSGNNGAIVIGGASCALTPGGEMNVNFTAQAPYRVNDTYRFSATALNGTTSVPVAETWTNDTEMEVVLSASLTLTIDPGTNAAAGTSPVPNCASCSFTLPATIEAGNVSNDGSLLATDVAEVDVSTDASSPEGWKLYVSTSTNPSNTGGTYTNELVSDVDSAHSISGAGVNYDQTSLGVIPATTGGMLLADTGSGTTPRRKPFGFVMNYEIYINGGPTTAETTTVTYTFIAN